MDTGHNTRVILLRHGQTVWNTEVVFRGQVDVPLDEVGHAQAAAVADALRDEAIVRVLSSPLSRAVETARPIAAQRGLEVEVDAGFMDVHFGVWQGLQKSEVEARWPEEFALWLAQPQNFSVEGAERLDAVMARAFGRLCEVVDEHPGQTIAIVAHRVITKLLLLAALGLDASHFWQIKQDTACINRLTLDRVTFGNPTWPHAIPAASADTIALSGGQSGIWVIEAMNSTAHTRALLPKIASADF